MTNLLSWLSDQLSIEYVNDQEISFPCPACGKEKRHFQFNIEKGLGHCFRCDYSVDTIGLVARIGKISLYEAKTIIESWRIPHIEKQEREEPINVILPPNTGWTPRARAYLKERDITEAMIEKFGLYYCGRGRYASRIILPIKYWGKEVSFQARSIIDNKLRYLSGPKAGSYLYGYQFVELKSEIIIVEGPFDALRLWQKGYQALATFGKKIGSNQLEKIEALMPVKVMLMFDSDVDVTEVYSRLTRRLSVSVALMDEGDPGDGDVDVVMKRAMGNLKEAKWLQVQRQLNI